MNLYHKNGCSVFTELFAYIFFHFLFFLIINFYDSGRFATKYQPKSQSPCNNLLPTFQH